MPPGILLCTTLPGKEGTRPMYSHCIDAPCGASGEGSALKAPVGSPGHLPEVLDAARYIFVRQQHRLHDGLAVQGL